MAMCQTWAVGFNALAAKHKGGLVASGAEAKPYGPNLTWCAILIVSRVTGGYACYLALVDTSGRTWNASAKGTIPKVDCAHPWKKVAPIA